MCTNVFLCTTYYDVCVLNCAKVHVTCLMCQAPVTHTMYVYKFHSRAPYITDRIVKPTQNVNYTRKVL